MSTAKSTNPFQVSNWNYLEQLGESSFSSLPNYYESDVVEPTAPTFRSVSPKVYNQQRNDYFEEIKEELQFGDDCDSLYEATLMNSNFLDKDLEETSTSIATNYNNSSLARLRQLLNHISPNYCNNSSSSLTSELIVNLAPSIRSQFSSSTKSLPQPVVPMVAFSIPNPCKSKGKGKFKPTL